MAKYDQGGGCACGLKRWCDCGEGQSYELQRKEVTLNESKTKNYDFMGNPIFVEDQRSDLEHCKEFNTQKEIKQLKKEVKELERSIKWLEGLLQSSRRSKSNSTPKKKP